MAEWVYVVLWFEFDGSFEFDGDNEDGTAVGHQCVAVFSSAAEADAYAKQHSGVVVTRRVR